MSYYTCVACQIQESALAELHDKINKAHLMWSERDPQTISFSAPTGSEKTMLKIEDKSDKIRVRDLVTIYSNFNAKYFKGGCIYFLNTQKLGSDKLLNGTSDTRQFFIWETLTKTAKRYLICELNPMAILKMDMFL